MDQAASGGPFATNLCSILRGRPQARADLTGGGDYPGVRGTVRFYQTDRGVVVRAEIGGLPQGEAPCQGRVFGFHIHAGTDCGGSSEEPFANAMSHFDPGGCQHPYHAGDLPPLFGSGGLAIAVFLTDRFSAEEVIGRTVIVHDHPDDLTTQPSGNSGTKIACGVIRRTPRPGAG